MGRRNRGRIASAILVLTLAASSLQAQAAPTAPKFTFMEMFFGASAVVGVATWLVRAGQRMGRLELRVENIEKDNKAINETIDKHDKQMELVARIDERVETMRSDIQQIKAMLMNLRN